MPTYLFECKKCKEVEEEFLWISQLERKEFGKCSKCGGERKRTYQDVPNFVIQPTKESWGRSVKEGLVNGTLQKEVHKEYSENRPNLDTI